MWPMIAMAGLQFLPTLLDTLFKLTQKAEDISPSGGGDDVKKPLVVGLINAAISAADQVADDGELTDPKQKEAISKLVSEAVDVVVGVQNTIGTFKHG